MEKPSVPATKVAETFELTLSLKERFLINLFLPDRGGLLEMKIAKQIEEKVSPTIIELSEVNYRELLDENGRPTGRAVWDSTKEKEVTISFTGIEIDFLKKQIDRLNSERNIRREMIDLIKKIEALNAA